MSLPALLKQILWGRGYRTEAEIQKFLQPALTDIPRPEGLLLDLDIALSILIEAKESKSQVIVFGDYDVDGTTSTALLVKSLRGLGYRIDPYIPHRIDEGYGVTPKAVVNMMKRFPETRLVITCDNGVASFEGIEALKKYGCKVIVTDHHEVPSERVSADAVINPKQKLCQYPDKKLAGVGVAFLLVLALRRALGAKDFSLTPFIDLVAIGTIADVAELVGVNRVFAKLGLVRLAKTEHIGLKVLMQHQELEGRPLNVRDIGFVIGPRLNASGRIGDPMMGLRLLLAETEAEAQPIVFELESKNRERRELQDQQVEWGLKEGQKLLIERPDRQSLVLMNSDFHLGIVGLIAGRLTQTFSRPTCALTQITDEHALADYQGEGTLWKGSMRAPAGYHLSRSLEWIRQKSPSLLVSGGGHALAAGVTLRDRDRDEFLKLFEAAITETRTEVFEVTAEAELDSPTVDLKLLRSLEPFGPGNPKPLFALKSFRPTKCSIMKELHLRLEGTKNGQYGRILQFRSPWLNLIKELQKQLHELELDLLVEPMENFYQGITRVDLELKDIWSVKSNGRALEVKLPSNAVCSSESARKANHDSNTRPIESRY